MMIDLKRMVRRASREDTTEHAITQVFLTMVMVVAIAPYSVAFTGAILVALAVVRGVHNV